MRMKSIANLCVFTMTSKKRCPHIQVYTWHYKMPPHF